MDFKDQWIDKRDGVDRVSAEHINQVAHGVIENEKLLKKTYSKEETNNLFCNALKGSASGEVVALNDISPIEHELGVTVKRKNLCSLGTVIVKDNNYTDYEIGTALPPLKDGQVYIISCLITSNDTDSDVCRMAFYDAAGTHLKAISLKRNERVYFASKDFAGASKLYLYPSSGHANSANDTATFADIQIEVANSGAASTDYAPYIEDISTVTLIVGDKSFPVNADGTIVGVVKSTYPSTTLMTDTAGAIIDCEYNRDINKAFLELQQAILTLGV